MVLAYELQISIAPIGWASVLASLRLKDTGVGVTMNSGKSAGDDRGAMIEVKFFASIRELLGCAHWYL
ncbi:MAG: hypothetical protein ACYDD9_01530 [Acidithiobacillus sp.]|uniref:Uncharacterized protein n=1 Tax=Acidithiobacillus ferruginosus TaxID=3063951 RepID=A0ACD5ILJ8_9PROT|nr:hypothetical protein [Acidithiobacillus ferruginosus]MBU2814520.1 hypothetical protein [Acidithiobacillus ferruginosus]